MLRGSQLWGSMLIVRNTHWILLRITGYAVSIIQSLSSHKNIIYRLIYHLMWHWKLFNALSFYFLFFRQNHFGFILNSDFLFQGRFILLLLKWSFQCIVTKTCFFRKAYRQWIIALWTNSVKLQTAACFLKNCYFKHYSAIRAYCDGKIGFGNRRYFQSLGKIYSSKIKSPLDIIPPCGNFSYLNMKWKSRQPFFHREII